MKGGRRWRDVEEANWGGMEEKIENEGTEKGAWRMIRSSEGQRGADKTREAGKRSRKKEMYQEKGD